ncbi:hypothetical protein ACQX25_06345 [Corynebacterium diphtheriae]|uniref:hypothetical protein n=1 Tax=Corynebacterium diphtheriae TaxID=1717 RepID=UPI0019808CF1|nr:hypothetical protein [Corynebacterium diphtheriae]MBN4650928.1 hypothetical protein [Corynebacterium diphtheriae bv. mitis]
MLQAFGRAGKNLARSFQRFALQQRGHGCLPVPQRPVVPLVPRSAVTVYVVVITFTSLSLIIGRVGRQIS